MGSRISAAASSSTDDEEVFVRTASAASAALLADDGGLVLNILLALSAESLGSMCCVAQAWASAEQENRSELWRRLSLQRWPDLGPGAAIDWRRRYRILTREGAPTEQVRHDPLANYLFVVQGRWGGAGPRGPPDFSAVVAAGRYKASLSMQGGLLEFNDAFELDAEFPPVPLPQGWRAAPGAARLDIRLLVRNLPDDTVAHWLSFSVCRPAIEPTLAQMNQPTADPNAGPAFTAAVDTAAHPTAAGCGPLLFDAHGKPGRVPAPWQTNFADTIPDGLESLVAGLRLEVAPLELRFVLADGEPRLRGLRLGLGMLVESAVGAGVPIDGPLPLNSKDVPATFEHCSWV